MIKRGQIYGDLFKYFLIAIIAVMILLFGINAFNKVRNASCRSGLILLESKLKESVETVSSDVGSISEEVFKIPCDIDKIYFVDLEGNKTGLLNSLGEFPLIQDAIKENIEKNAFLVKGDKVVESFYAGDIELQKPYFVCSNTARGNLGVYLGGKGTSTELFNKECAYDCTFEIINVDNETAKDLIKDAIDFNCQGCPKGYPGANIDEQVDIEYENFKTTNQTVKIARRCNCGRKPGETVVEILIKPEGTLEHFKLIEKIPKDYVDNLDEFIKSVHGNYSYFKIKSDPLIMWHFNEISKETIVQYTIEKDILEYCADAFKTVGLEVTTLSEGVSSDDDLDMFVKDIPILNLNDISIPKGSTNYLAFKKPVWQYLNASDILPSEKKGYNYQIAVDTSSSGSSSASYSDITCKIRESDKHIVCDTSSSFSGPRTFHISVLSSGQKIAGDDFSVTKFDCGSLNKIQCKQQPSNCEWCVKCNVNNKWSGNINDMCVNKGACSYGDGTDIDGDGFNRECGNDCSDDPSNPNSGRIPNSANPYCDCNPSDGFTNGTEENASLCFDNMDNNCDGNVDGCSKLKCTKRVVHNDCVCVFDDECSSKGWRDGNVDWGGCWCGFMDWGDEYDCYYDWETECMEGPACVGGSPLGSPISCVAICTDNDGDGYNVSGGVCGAIDCNDTDTNVHPGAAGICDGKDNDCNGQVDEGYNNENCQYTCQKSGYTWTNKGGNLNCCGNNANEANPYQASETTCTDGNDNDCNGKKDCVDTTNCPDNTICGVGKVCQGGSCVSAVTCTSPCIPYGTDRCKNSVSLTICSVGQSCC